MHYGYIYKFTNLVNGKIYVYRHKFSEEHLDESYYGSGTIWENVLKVEGEANIQREVLEYCDTLSELNEAEKYWIAILDARNRDIGYNIAPGGDGGYLGKEAIDKANATKKVNGTDKPWNKGLTKLTDARVAKQSKILTGRSLSSSTKKKLSEQARTRLADKSNHPLYGRHWVEGDLGTSRLIGRKLSQEAKANMSKAQKASMHNKGQNNGMYGVHRFGGENPRAIKIKCIEANKEFDCIKDANSWLINTIGHGGHIGDCLKGKKETICGYHWVYID